MKRLMLIRHGETEFTRRQKFCGHENIPLNENGIRQARLLQGRMKKFKIDRVYSSDLKRAMETAKIIFKKRRIIKKGALREFKFGRLSGMTFKEAEKLYPDFCMAFTDDPAAVEAPGGEGFLDLSRRVLRSYAAIARYNKGKVVAIVAHGGVIRMILLNILGLGVERFWEIEQDTAAVNVVDFRNGAAKVRVMNDTGHLK